MERTDLGDGYFLAHHNASDCHGPFCSIHNPSDHPLRRHRLNWREDRGLMERICDHGIGHPDPDDLAFKRNTLTAKSFDDGAWGVHGCDGCCHAKDFAA